jgi:hypothetical protein
LGTKKSEPYIIGHGWMMHLQTADSIVWVV